MAAASVDNDNLRRKVFNYICSRGGVIPFPLLLKPPSPLSKMGASEVIAWLKKEIEESHPFFLQYRGGKSGHIDSVRLRFKIRFCLTYLRSRTCRYGDRCKNFHICKAFVEGTCKDSAQCGLSHRFHDSANVAKLRELSLGSLPEGALKNIIANNLPQVCKAYIEGSCQDRNQCSSLHICDKFVQYVCSPGKLPCEFSHDLKSDHSSLLMKKFGFAGKFSDELLICNILLPKGSRMKVESGNPPNENLNDLSDEKKMPGKFGLFGDKPNEKEATWKKQVRGQKKPGAGKQGSREEEVEVVPKMNIGERISLRGSADWSGFRLQERFTHNRRGRGAADHHSRGRGRGRGNEARGLDGCIDTEFLFGKVPDLMKMQVEMSKKSQLDPEEKGDGNGEGPGKRHRQRRRKGGKGKDQAEPAEAEEAPEPDNFNLIDLSENEPQSQSMSHVDMSIDDMLSMDDLEKQSAPCANADDMDDQWMDSLLSQTSSHGSSLDLLGDLELSEKDTLASAAAGPNERAIVLSICKEYDGTVAFLVLAQRKDLFPCTPQESEKWLRSKPRRFLLLENRSGKIEEVSVISLGARMCFLYQMQKGKCSKPNCYFFHLCKEYVIYGKCSFGDSCRLGHNFRSKHNRPLLKKLGVANFTENELRNLLIASGPQVCLDYNEFSCDKGSQCNKIHVCKDFVKNKCTGECSMAHDLGLSTPHSKHVLAKFHLQNAPPKGIYRMLMVCEEDGGAVNNTQKELQVAEHIHQDFNTHICDRFIVGHCGKGRGCLGHHYHLPYLWQYKTSGEHSQWQSFGTAESEDIDNAYCDVNQVNATLTNIPISSPETLLIDTGDNSLKINFKDMQAVADLGTVQLRRLSTKSAEEFTDAPVSTQWVWYWQGDGDLWKMYEIEGSAGSDIQSDIESKYLKSELSYEFSTTDQTYKVFFGNKPMYQQNMNPRSYKTREVRRRPVFKSQEDVQKFTREISGGSQDVLEGLPSHWASMQESDTFMRVKLHPSSDEYRRVSHAFHRSMKGGQAVIVGIERVQNPFLWEKMSRKRDQMRKESSNHGDAVEERQLFHGLSPSHVNITCKKNFNWRLYGQESATFGHGAYFMLDSSLANQSSSEDAELNRFTFLADVLVGSFAQGAPMLLGPPQKCPSDPSSDFYDSCVDDMESPSVFVVFDADQFYPSFLVCYKFVAEPICD